MSKKRPAWKAQEKRLAKEGARRVPGSGSGFLKGDNKGENFLVQAKTTRNRQYPLKVDEVKKSIKEASLEDRIMVMQIEFQCGERVAILRWKDFRSIIEDADLDL